ncbi:hypothetical protein ScPMuIL_010895 [Solemya velum]
MMVSIQIFPPMFLIQIAPYDPVPPNETLAAMGNQNVPYNPVPSNGTLAAMNNQIVPYNPLPPNETLAAMSGPELLALQQNYVKTNQVLCKHPVRIGRGGDGGWDICEDEAYKPKKPCLVYSFGINGDYSFDDGIVKRYGCEVHSFDPTMNIKEHKHAPSVWFHPIGLAGRNGEMDKIGPIMTLGSIRKLLNHTHRAIDILKVDIEGMEWESLSEMKKSGALSDIPQLAFEFHSNAFFKPKYPDYKRGLLMDFDIYTQLYDAGYQVFHTHQNEFSTWRHIPSMPPFARCTNKFKTQFESTKYPIMAAVQFDRKKQMPGETFGDFVTDLKLLARGLDLTETEKLIRKAITC